MSVEVEKAIALLNESETAQAGSPHQQIIQHTEKFAEAMLILREYVEEHPDSPELQRIENLRLSHTRKLLKELPSTVGYDAGHWWRFFACLLLSKKELDALKERESQIAMLYEDFISVYVNGLDDVCGLLEALDDGFLQRYCINLDVINELNRLTKERANREEDKMTNENEDELTKDLTEDMSDSEKLT